MESGTAWGKLTRDPEGREIARLSLVAHCLDVAAVVEALLRISNLRRRIELLAGRVLCETDVQRLAVLAFLHDIGKANLGFQSKALPDAERQHWLRRAGCSHAHCGHTREIGALLQDAQLQQRACAALPLRQIQSWDAELALLFAAISHHGTPLRYSDLNAQARNAWNTIPEYDPWQALTELGTAAQRLFPAAFVSTAHELPEANAFVHAFAGLVSLADWIGSNPSAMFFPYDLAEGDARRGVAAERAVRVLRAMRIDVEDLRDELRSRDLAFGDVFRDPRTGRGYEPTEIQREASHRGTAPTMVLEAETGSGKTEAALWRFKTLFETGAVDALAFVLPTRVSAVQICRRIENFMAALFPDPARRPNVVLAVPGYLRVDGVDALQRLAGFEVLWPDSALENVAHLRWASENGKRFLTAACAVGTIDQVLLSGMQVRHAHLRGFALLRSLLVVDEVHASDRYMSSLLGTVLRRHEAAGGHALLLSATLGVAARHALLGLPARPAAAGTMDSQLAPYPCLSTAGGSRAVAAGTRSKRVHMMMQPWIDEPAQIAAQAADAVRRGGRVLVVRNTVAGVIAVQAELEAALGSDHPALFRCHGVVCPHHGRFAGGDRIHLDEAVEARFGKRSAALRAVLCGSQTLEQSLDIDADLLITDLAPVDVLLQRLGRLHRHGDRARPDDFVSPRAIVLTPAERDLSGFLRNSRLRHGLGGHVYPDLLSIDATWDVLAESTLLEVPTDNRRVVERCTDPEILQQRAEQRGGDWLSHWQQLNGKKLGQAKEAFYARLDWNSAWEDCAFPGSEEKVRTRLGAEAVRLPLLQPWLSPFGARLEEIAVPAWMWRGAADEQPQLIAQSGGDALSISTPQQQFRYSRHGLEETKAAQ